jgi:hypothetical protein
MANEPTVDDIIAYESQGGNNNMANVKFKRGQ